MSTSCQRLLGWLLAFVGILVAVFSQQIVFPWLERLVGIETIVGPESIVYQPDGSYVFTNPGVMSRWIVAGMGLIIALIGAFLLFRARRERRDSHAHASA